MSNATRLLVLLDDGQHAALKKLSDATGAPMAHHVRRAVDAYLHQGDFDSVDALMPPVRTRRGAIADDSRKLLPAVRRTRRKK